jgi:hypothetical protein
MMNVDGPKKGEYETNLKEIVAADPTMAEH